MYRGSNLAPKIRTCRPRATGGRGAFLRQRSRLVRDGGVGGRENVGMSNRKSDEKSDHRKPKVSLAMEISQGLGEPKATPKGLVDGQPVNIPALLHFLMK